MRKKIAEPERTTGRPARRRWESCARLRARQRSPGPRELRYRWREAAGMLLYAGGLAATIAIRILPTGAWRSDR